MFRNRVKILNKKYYILFTILLLVISLSVGFSAFQKELLMDDILFHVRLQTETRVSDVVLESTSNAISNSEDYNVKKILGNVTFNSTNSYVLYKVDLTNYGNVKTGLLNITNSGDNVNYQVCDSNADNCTDDFETSVCNGSNCTLGSTKTIYVKVSSTTTGTKNINLDLDFEPYNNITYNNFMEDTTLFRSEVLTNGSYELTFTSSPEDVIVTGSATSNYDKEEGVLTISNVQSALTITAKYMLNTVAEPSNYVRFNGDLFRIIKTENVNDGYGNTEYRVKIVKHESIGKKIFDTTTNEYSSSTLYTDLNTTYYNSLTAASKSLIDTVLFKEDTIGYFGLISSDDYSINDDWLTYEEYTLDTEGDNILAVIEGDLVESLTNVNLDTHPVTYLKEEVLIVSGSGTQADPYILDLHSSSIESNPTNVSARTLTMNSTAQDLVTVSNRVGTVYFSTTNELSESNYTDTSISSTTIPSATATGTYTIYYYIPATNGYKPKAGRVTSKINGITYTITYQKEEDVTSIGKNSDTCTTSGTATSCSVTLPTITLNNGGTVIGWTDGTNTYDPGDSFTLSSNGTVLTATATVVHNYKNTTTLAYYQTLQSAFNEVGNNQTIQVQGNIGDSIQATLASTKTGIKLDFNGYKVSTYNTQFIINNGQLDIYNSSSTGAILQFEALSNTGGIYNNGTLTFNAQNAQGLFQTSQSYDVMSSSKILIYNTASGNITINQNTELKTTLSTSISNYGSVTMTGGEIFSAYQSLNHEGATFTMSGGLITKSGIKNYGTMSVSGSTASAEVYSTSFVENYGSLTLSGSGTFANTENYSTRYCLEIKNGNVTITDGTYSIKYGDAVLMTNGNLTITGGIISAIKGHAIYISNGSLNIGTNDSTVSTTIPAISTAASGSDAYYGVSAATTATFNFYDGLIKSGRGTGYAINRDPDNIPSGYYVHKELDGSYEKAYLLKKGFLMAGEDTDSSSNFLRTTIAKQDIEEITFTGSISGHTVNGTTCFDVSLEEDGSVLAWVEDSDNNGKYEMTIGSSGKVFASSGENLFFALYYLKEINGMEYFDTSVVTNMSHMFEGCTNLTSLDLSHFDTSNVTDMSAMFWVNRYGSGFNDKITTLDLSSFDTSNVEDMRGMFTNRGALETINLSSFNTSNVTNMAYMFSGCHWLQTFDISHFDTSNVTDMSAMFWWCQSIQTLDLSNFDTSKVTDMSSMFNECNNLTSLDLSSFNTPLLENTFQMFRNCSSLVTIKATSSFVTTNVTNSTDMFYKCYDIVGGQGTVYDSNNIDKAYAHIDGGLSNPGYFTNSNSIVATFIYNTNTTSGSITVSSTNASCVPDSGQTTCTITVPSVVTSSVGKYNSTYKGVSTSFSDMNSSNLTIGANTTYYANYSKSVTHYYFNGSTYTSRTLYRNEYFSGASTMESRLATSNTSTTNYTTETGKGSAVWLGLSRDTNASVEYSSVQAAANSGDSPLYTVYKYDVTYAIGTNVSAIGSTSGTCNVYAINGTVSCNVTLPTISVGEGFSSAGWSTTNGASTGTGAGSSYALTTNGSTLYANANKVIYKITLNNQSATSAGTTEVWYHYKHSAVVNGTTCYYYTNSSLTTCLTNGTTISLPSKTNYIFGGYYTATNGGGTQYVNASGGFINTIYQKTPSEINSSYTDTITLYAKWTQAYYSIGTNYYTTLANAFSAAASSGSTIKLLSNYTDSSSASTNKTVTLDLNSKTLTRSAEITSSGGALTVKNGTLSSSANGLRTSGGNIVINGLKIQATGYAIYVSAGSGTISSSNTSYIYSTKNTPIYLNNTGGNITLDSTYLYTPVKNKNVIRLGTKSGLTITIKGDSYVGMGYSNTDGDGTGDGQAPSKGNTTPFYLGSGSTTLNLQGNTKVMAGAYARCGVEFWSTSNTLSCTGASSIYVNNSAMHDVWTEKSTSTGNKVTFNSTGEFFAKGTRVLGGDAKVTLTTTKGHFAANNDDKYMMNNNGTYTIQASSKSTKTFYNMNAYNGTTTSTLKLYAVNKGL